MLGIRPYISINIYTQHMCAFVYLRKYITHGHIMTAKIGMMHPNIEVMGMIKFSV